MKTNKILLILASICLLTNCVTNTKTATPTNEQVTSGLLAFEYEGVNVPKLGEKSLALRTKVINDPTTVTKLDIDNLVDAATTFSPDNISVICLEATTTEAYVEMVRVVDRIYPQALTIKLLETTQTLHKEALAAINSKTNRANYLDIPLSAFYFGNLNDSNSASIANILRKNTINRYLVVVSVIYQTVNSIESENTILAAAGYVGTDQTTYQERWNTTFGAGIIINNDNIQYDGLFTTTFGVRAGEAFNLRNEQEPIGISNGDCEKDIPTLANIPGEFYCLLDPIKVKASGTNTGYGGFGNLAKALTKGDIDVHVTSAAALTTWQRDLCK